MLDIVPVCIAISVRRLKFLKKTVQHPDHHAQWLAAMFGTMPFEPQLFMEDGTIIMDNAHPWVLQLLDDFQRLRIFETFEIYVDTIIKRPLLLFKDEDISTEFCNLDLSYIKAAALTSTFDWGIRDTDTTRNQFWAEQGECEQTWTCRETNVNGHCCNLIFSSRRALFAHIRFAKGGTHGTRAMAYTLVVSNQSPWCCTVFNNKIIAQHHVSRMVQTGICFVDVSPVDYVLNEAITECPACGDVFGSFAFCSGMWLNISIALAYL